MIFLLIILFALFSFICGAIFGIYLVDLFNMNKHKTKITTRQAFKMLDGYRVVGKDDKSLRDEIRHSWIVREWSKGKMII